MSAGPWLSSFGGEKGGMRRRPPFSRPCMSTLVGLLALIILSYSMALLFFGKVNPKQSSPEPSSQNVIAHTDSEPDIDSGGGDGDDLATAVGKVMPVRQPASSNSISFNADFYNVQEKYGKRPFQKFHTTKTKTPFFHANTFVPKATEGNPYFFMTPAVNDQKGTVQIFSRKDLSLVYNDHGYRATNNFRMQEYNGKQYLTFWEGIPAPGHGLGQGVMIDENYKLAYNISINTFNSEADSHEFQLTHDGGALFSVYETVRGYDMSPVGGPVDGVLQDSCFEEVDIKTGETRFAWRASDWFSITETTVGYNDVEDYGHPTNTDGWDFFHINSLEKTKDGNYLVLGRRLNLITLINGTSGEPIWQIGGKNNQYADLSDGAATNFAYQHHARFVNDEETEIVMFDNAQLANTQPSPGCKEQCSRGLHIRMDHEAKTAEVVRSYWHPQSLQARAEGSAEKQPNGNLLVGWGKAPAFTEYSADGQVLLDVQTGPWSADNGEAHVYRIYSGDWKGSPTWDPEIVMHEGDIYVSWNGATEQAYWVLVSILAARIMFWARILTCDDHSSPATPGSPWSPNT